MAAKVTAAVSVLRMVFVSFWGWALFFISSWFSSGVIPPSGPMNAARFLFSS